VAVIVAYSFCISTLNFQGACQRDCRKTIFSRAFPDPGLIEMQLLASQVAIRIFYPARGQRIAPKVWILPILRACATRANRVRVHCTSTLRFERRVKRCRPQKEKAPMPFAWLGAIFIPFGAYPSRSNSLGLTLLIGMHFSKDTNAIWHEDMKNLPFGRDDDNALYLEEQPIQGYVPMYF
jgi:hypothetical protein